MKKLVALLLAVVMVLSLAACGAKAPEADPGNNAPKSTESAGGNENPQKSSPVKDSVTLAIAGDPYRFFALSPKGCGGDDNLVLSNVYDCLLFLEADGSLSPALAESYELSEDGLTYTFHLRKGVLFQNGKEMTAEDVQFTFDMGFAGPIGTALFVNYDHCNIVDDYTIEIVLSSPYAAFPYGVASRLGGICCKSYYEEVGDEGYMNAPIGTGPYKLTEYVSGDHVTLTAFEDHWRGAPEIKTVTIAEVADVNTQVLGLQNGDYDVMRNPSIEICSRLENADGISTSIADSTGRITLYLGAWAGYSADINFRKAVQAAINKDEINIAVNNGAATILDIDVCPMYGGCPKEGVEVVKYDVEAAKEYLANSSYDGGEWSILVQSGSTFETAVKVIQAQLMGIGINCQVKAVDNMTYSECQASRNFDAMIGENLSSLIDTDALISYFIVTKYDANVKYPREAEIYETLMKARATQGDARLGLYADVCNILTGEAYNVPLYNGVTTVAYNSNLSGVEAHCLGSYNFRLWSWNA